MVTEESRNRIWEYIFWSLLVVGLLAVLGRCWYFQYYKTEDFQKQAAKQQLKIIPQSARRGLIVDRQGRILALSMQVSSVRTDPILIEDKRDAAEKLSAILNLDSRELFQEIQAEADKRFIWVKRAVTDQQADQVCALKIRGVVVEHEFQRQYPMGQLAAHVVGFTDIDGKGLEGLEKSYEEYLAGRSGRMLLRSDVQKRAVGSLGDCETGQNGLAVVSTIDAVIQACVEEEIEKVVAKFHAKGATAIVMVPSSGEVLAMANLPTFEPTMARKSDGDVRRNQALTDPYEPGSAFKPFTLASALEGGFVTMEQEIDCLEGPYSGKGFRPIKEYKNYFGLIPVSDIIVRSSNIGAAKLAEKMGKDYFHKMVEKFGFGEKTGIDLPGEGAGILRKRWDDKKHTLTRVGFGQGIAVTPIQLVRAFCCLVNGGKLIKPRVVRGIIGSNNEVVEDFGQCQVSLWAGESGVGSDEAGRIISERVSREIVEKALVEVVAREGGTANNANLTGWRVFGKTGTAQIAKKDGPGYEENKYISSFIAGAPAEDPQVCVLVLVRQPDRSLGLGYTGGAVAAPVVREILKQTLAYLNVPKSANEPVIPEKSLPSTQLEAEI